MNDKEYGLLIPFDDESTSFTNGFEAGMIYAEMQRKEALISRSVHEENEGLIRRMAEHEGYDVVFAETKVDGWLYVTLQCATFGVINSN